MMKIALFFPLLSRFFPEKLPNCFFLAIFALLLRRIPRNNVTQYPIDKTKVSSLKIPSYP